MADNDFLFTWKADKWPYEKLRALIDRFEEGSTVTEHWRCQAHRQIRQGARAYLYKQGSSPKGIFAIADVVSDPFERPKVEPGEARYAVELRFRVLLDPSKRFLVNEEQLAVLGASPNQLNTNGSGVAFSAKVARSIDEIAAQESTTSVAGSPAVTESPAAVASRHERLSEVYDRDQSLVLELRQKYQGKCQVCDSAPFKACSAISPKATTFNGYAAAAATAWTT